MTKTVKWLVFVSMVMTWAGAAEGQQLLVVKKGSVVTRYDVGEEIYFQLKDQRQVHHTSIRAIREFYFLTMDRDSIPYMRVQSLHFRNYDRKRYGAVTTLTSFGFLALYGLNAYVLDIDENTPSMRGLKFIAFTGIAVGTIIYLRSERSLKLGGKTRLKYAAYDSPLYR
jgi:hypothetical protein